MKTARFFACIFGILGTVLMAFSIGLCLLSLDKEAELKAVPAEAAACAETLMQAIDAGDYAAAAGVLYGQPDLGADREPANEAGVMIWDAFRDSISCEFAGEWYVTDAGIARDVVITSMDIASVTHAIMTAKVEAATDMAELYDENNGFREDLVEAVLSEAVVRAMAEDAETVTREVTLTLIQRDGRWWVVPEDGLLQAISGGLA